MYHRSSGHLSLEKIVPFRCKAYNHHETPLSSIQESTYSYHPRASLQKLQKNKRISNGSLFRMPECRLAFREALNRKDLRPVGEGLALKMLTGVFVLPSGGFLYRCVIIL